MSWVKRTPIPASTLPHRCQPPETERPPEGTPTHMSWLFLVPDGGPRSVWRCDVCCRLYRVVRGTLDGRLLWMPATWWQRLRHGWRPR